VTLFRGIGGALGTAVFGSIFTHRLTGALHAAQLPPALRAIVAGGGRLTGAQVSNLPAAAKGAYERAYVHALTPVFEVAAIIAFAGFLLSWLLPEKPLRATAATSTGLEDGLAAPKAPDSLAEIERALAVATTVEERRRFRRAVAERAGIDVSPGGVWALVRMEELGVAGAKERARSLGVPEDRIEAVVDELRSNGLIGEVAPTDHGVAVARELVEARRSVLCDFLDDPEAQDRPEVASLLSALSRELAGARP
jgi:hypothetical protein